MQDNVATAHLRIENQCCHVEGSIDFQNVMPLLRTGIMSFSKIDAIQLDFKNASAKDSSMLAMILEWLEWGKSHNKTITVKNLPENVQSLAKVSGVWSLLQG